MTYTVSRTTLVDEGLVENSPQRRLRRRTAVACAVAALCAAFAPPPASRAVDGCPPLAAALDPGGVVAAEAWIECPDPSAAAAPAPVVPMALQGVAAAPAMIATGNVADASLPNDSRGTTTEFDTFVRGAWDVSVLKLDIVVPEDANCLTFDFAFASEEQSEFRGSQFNDGFVAELDGSSWSVSGGSIDAPDNFAVDANGALISINSATFNTDPETGTGTEYDGATDRLVAQTPASPGEHSLYLSIFDASDAKYDSAVWVANLAADQRTDGACTPGVNEAPHAEIVADPVAGAAPLGVAFSGVDSTDDGEIVAYDWDFGDAQIGSGVTADHVYETGGSYTAKLTVTDDAGLTAAASVGITVEGGNAAPHAEFTAVPDFGDPPLTVAFDAAGSSDSDGEVIMYAWDFGDGTSGAGPQATHDYPTAGSFLVRLAVVDDIGGVGYAERTIFVGSGPPIVDHVSVQVYGIAYWNTLWATESNLSAGDLDVQATNGRADTVSGSAVVPAPSGGGEATVTFAVRRLAPFPFYFGWVRVIDPTAGTDLGAPFVGMIANPEPGVAVGANYGFRLLPPGGPLFEGIKISWRVVDAA